MKCSKRSMSGYIRHLDVKLENNIRLQESCEELLEELDPSDLWLDNTIRHELDIAKSNIHHLTKALNHMRKEREE